jgi:hypothetical protein
VLRKLPYKFCLFLDQWYEQIAQGNDADRHQLRNITAGGGMGGFLRMNNPIDCSLAEATNEIGHTI